MQAQRLEDPGWTLARYVPRVPTSFARKKGVEMTRAPILIIFSESICTYIPHLSIYFIRFWRIPRMTTEPATSDAMPSQPHPAPVQHLWSSVQEPLWTYPQQGWSLLEIGGLNTCRQPILSINAYGPYGTCFNLVFIEDI